MKSSLHLIIIISLIACGLFATACHHDADGSDAVALERFDRAVVAYPSMSQSQRDSVVSQYAGVIDMFSAITGVQSADSLMEAIAASDWMRVFEPDVESRFTAIPAVETGLGGLRSSMAKELPSVKFPSHVVGIVSPYAQQVILASDTVVMIALNHYLGADYEGYEGFDAYRRSLRKPERIPYDVAEAIVAVNYPFSSSTTPTVLNQLLYQGAIGEAVRRLVPDASDQSALAYDDVQWQWLLDNETNIWRRMVESDMLFSTDPTVADRLIAPSPATSIIHPEAPGRVGRFVGLRLVQNYLKNHPEATLAYILSPQFYASANTPSQLNYSPN